FVPLDDVPVSLAVSAKLKVGRVWSGTRGYWRDISQASHDNGAGFLFHLDFNPRPLDDLGDVIPPYLPMPLECGTFHDARHHVVILVRCALLFRCRWGWGRTVG